VGHDVVDEPETKLPVRLISFALRSPTDCGRNTLIPPPGVTPTRAWVSPNFARSDATRKSQASASSKPPVTAAPLIAPMTGFVIVQSTVKGLTIGWSRLPTRFAAVLPSSRRSRPAQNAGSVPVRITTSTSSSASASASAPADSRWSALSSALRTSGRLSVRVRTRSAVSTKTMSVTPRI
jgi:hypothetical protein